ncbi:hypothetical protein BurJ1DRAFT_0907 [Burkholderiales bacterium JOSHI_001]|nr:hypothetical protein BurJ1DRAFT_0907 [Burkholderiales bacterium JOSHI_001]
MVGRQRDRVCIDLRGLGAQLQARADACGMTTAALVRSSLIHHLSESSDEPDALIVAGAPKDDCLKVTLRIPVGYALLLARRARKAETSQGRYVAGLLDGFPPRPITPALEQVVSALVGSTYQLAALSGDINAHLRALRAGERGGFDLYRVNSEPVPGLIQRHLSLASQVVAALQPERRERRDAAVIRRAEGKKT